jgi:hypothetical protein
MDQPLVDFRLRHGFFTRVLRPKGLEVTLDELLHAHFRGARVKAPVMARYEQALRRANAHLEPAVLWRSLSKDDAGAMMERLRSASRADADLLFFLQECERGVDIVLCTIGPRLEAEIGRLSQNEEVSRAYILDAVGSLAVARLARWIWTAASQQYAYGGWRIGPPVVPGTRNVSLRLQRILFEFADPTTIGVRLTNKDIMLPLKSMSMLWGVGENMARSNKVVHHCETCTESSTCFLRLAWEDGCDPAGAAAWDRQSVPWILPKATPDV